MSDDWRLLDVGCGDTSTARQHDWPETYDYVGIDNDASAVESGRTRGLDVRLVDATWGLPFDDASFDLVVCKAILEHLPDPVAVLRECHRVLGPHGGLLAVVPSDRSYDLWGDSTHKRGYRRDALHDDLREAMFNVETIDRRMGWDSPVMVWRSLKRGLAPWTPYGWPRAWQAVARKGPLTAGNGGRTTTIPEVPEV